MYARIRKYQAPQRFRERCRNRGPGLLHDAAWRSTSERWSVSATSMLLSISTSMSSQMPATADLTTGLTQCHMSGSLIAASLTNVPMFSSMRLRMGAETWSSCSFAKRFFSSHHASKSGMELSGEMASARPPTTTLTFSPTIDLAIRTTWPKKVTDFARTVESARCVMLLFLALVGRSGWLLSKISLLLVSLPPSRSESAAAACSSMFRAGSVMVSPSSEIRTVYRFWSARPWM
mmetsp:Transcript_6404/g.19356  ORF Transcript_6404/g.19356 Transcript_6404/m.19356 type:complete len:234 (-) Transcript_6404:804-1505(-)